MSPCRLRDRCPRNPPLYSDESVRAFSGGNRLELCTHEGIAAHGTTTAPAAIVAAI
jgi:hypothetical protein